MNFPRHLAPAAHLNELSTIKRGWPDGVGLAPDTAGLDWPAEALATRFPDDNSMPIV